MIITRRVEERRTPEREGRTNLFNVLYIYLNKDRLIFLSFIQSSSSKFIGREFKCCEVYGGDSWCVFEFVAKGGTGGDDEDDKETVHA